MSEARTSATVTTLVTGATGFLGTQIVRQLVARGDRVRALDLPAAGWSRLAGLPIVRLDGDVTDRACVAAAVRGVDRVLHVAALYKFGFPDRARMEAVNVGGAANVLEEAATRGVTAVHVSTVAALGPTGEALVGETHWAGEAPRSDYEGSKRRAHELARRLAAQGASVRIALPATIYGPGDPSLVGKAEALVARGRMLVGARPGLKLCFVHVDDCADGVIRVADRGVDGGEYVLSAEVLTIRAWLTALARAHGRRPPALWLPDGPLDRLAAAAGRVPGVPARLLRELLGMSAGRHWAFSGERARRELGWTPRLLPLVSEAGARSTARPRAARAVAAADG